MNGPMKNIDKAQVLVLRDQVAYQDGQIVSKTLAQNNNVSITLFSFDKGEEISSHKAGGDAFVTCLDGTGRTFGFIRTPQGWEFDETSRGCRWKS